MCGIVGILSKDKEAAPLLVESLKRLEYRGYDSAGIATVVNGRLAIDFSDAGQRQAVVDKLAPTMIDKLKEQKSENGGSASTSDTSYLKGADPRLTRQFMTGFNTSAVSIYWVGLGVIVLAFILSWFFKVPPLRQRSALQEQADKNTAAQLAES